MFQVHILLQQLEHGRALGVTQTIAVGVVVEQVLQGVLI